MRQKLTDLAVKNAKALACTPRKIADANGLYLHVEPTGAKYWRYRYRTPDGRERINALGSYPELSLSEARKRHGEARAKVLGGVDPVQVKREVKAAKQAAAKNSFESIAREWHARKKGDWTPANAVRIL
jgi:Arm DNA-binding domain